MDKSVFVLTKEFHTFAFFALDECGFPLYQYGFVYPRCCRTTGSDTAVHKHIDA